MKDRDKVKLRHSLLNETRVAIVARLLSRARNISELVKELRIDRSTVCYHLNIMEDVGILESDYVILQAPRSPGRAARVFKINHDKLKEALEAIDELRREIKV